MTNNMVFLPKNAETRLRILHAVSRPIDAITVGELCETSGVSRQTFYRYFNSKYDIAYWFLNLIDELYLDRIGRTLSWDESYDRACTMIYEERAHMKYAFARNPEDNEVEPRLSAKYKTIYETLHDYKHAEMDDELLFFLHFYVYQGHDMVVNWCVDGMPHTPQQFKSFFTKCIPLRLRKLLWEPAEEPRNKTPPV